MPDLNFIPDSSGGSTFRGIDPFGTSVIQEVTRVSWGSNAAENLVDDVVGKRLPVKIAEGGPAQFAEDAPHASGDTGTVALGVRQDADVTPVTADGDYHTLLFDAVGNLKVNVKAGAAGGVTHTDDAPFTPAVDDGVPMFGLFDDTAPDSVDEGDAGAVRMSVNRNLYMRIRDNAGNERGVNVTASSELTVLASAQPGVDVGDVTVNNGAGAGAVNIQDGGNSLTVDGTVTANAGAGTFLVDTELPAAAALADATGNPTTPLAGAALEFFNGTTWDRVRGDITNGLDVDVTRLPALVAGTANIGDVDIASFVAGAITEVQGDVAHDAVAAGNPVLLAGISETPDDTAPTNQVSADGDATRVAVDRDGAVFTHPHPPRIWHTANEFTTAQTDTSLKAAPGAGLSLYVTDIVVHCNGAVTVTLEEGITTLKFRYYANGVGDGSAPSFVVPIKLAVNTALTVTTNAAVTVFVGVNGYTAP